MGDLLESAVEAARIGGEILLTRRGRRPAQVDEKSANDFVTDVDRASQRAVVDFLRRRHPGHAILAEEGEAHPGGSGYCWIIDPLDGTTNFIHDYPFFAVSVGLWRGDQPVVGAVLDPVRGELFRAERGGGAWLQDRRLQASRQDGLRGSLLVTGFPFRMKEQIEPYLASFADLFPRCAGVRRDGSAALDLCYVACGRVDGFWEMGLSPWDLAAGVLLVQEAGGRTTDYAGREGFMDSGNIVAAGAGVHAELLEVLRRHHGEG